MHFVWGKTHHRLWINLTFHTVEHKKKVFFFFILCWKWIHQFMSLVSFLLLKQARKLSWCGRGSIVSSNELVRFILPHWCLSRRNRPRDIRGYRNVDDSRTVAVALATSHPNSWWPQVQFLDHYWGCKENAEKEKGKTRSGGKSFSWVSFGFDSSHCFLFSTFSFFNFAHFT